MNSRFLLFSAVIGVVAGILFAFIATPPGMIAFSVVVGVVAVVFPGLVEYPILLLFGTFVTILILAESITLWVIFRQSKRTTA